MTFNATSLVYSVISFLMRLITLKQQLGNGLKNIVETQRSSS